MLDQPRTRTMQSSTKTMLAFLAVTGSGTLFQPTMVHATPVMTLRCTHDPVDTANVRLRLEWARACGTKINVISPTNPTAPAQAVLTGTSSINGGIPLWEY